MVCRAARELPDECHTRWTVIWLTHPPLTLLYDALFAMTEAYPDIHIHVRERCYHPKGAARL